MIKILVCFLLTTPLLSFAKTPSQAASCVACHGPMGISMNPIWPNLAGQKVDYLKKELNDFKSGKRKNPLMNGLAKTLSHEDIETLAKYYSNLK